MKACDTCGGQLGDDYLFGVCPRCLFSDALGDGPSSPPSPWLAPFACPAVQPSLSRLPSRRDFFERYELQKRVGGGGQGEVFEAWDHDLRRTVALKRLAEAHLRSEPAVYRFLAEAQIASQIEHPGILPVYDVGVDPDGRPFYTTSLLPGTTLGDLFRQVHDPSRSEWTIRRALELVIRLCEIICFAHSRGVIHRDLKPSNILVGQFGDLRVIDWGSAHVSDEVRATFQEPFASLDESLVETDRADAILLTGDSPLSTSNAGQPVTFLYMPPEILAGNSDQFGPRTDIYSVGVMLYELCTGRMPYARADGTLPNRMDLIEIILNGPSAPVRQINSSVPRDLAAICGKAMAWKRADRYESMQDLAEDICACLDTRVVEACRPGPLTRLKKWAVRNSRYLALGISCLSSGKVMTFFRRQRRSSEATASWIRFTGEKGSLAEMAYYMLAG